MLIFHYLFFRVLLKLELGAALMSLIVSRLRSCQSLLFKSRAFRYQISHFQWRAYFFISMSILDVATSQIFWIIWNVIKMEAWVFVTINITITMTQRDKERWITFWIFKAFNFMRIIHKWRHCIKWERGQSFCDNNLLVVKIGAITRIAQILSDQSRMTSFVNGP